MKLYIYSIVLSLFLGYGAQAQSFEDGPGRELDGDFPRNWDLIKGSAQVGTFERNKVILFENGGIITPKIDGTDYLSDSFTLEFEAYFDEITYEVHNDYYKVRFWDGTTYARFDNKNGSGLYHPLTVYRHGAQIKGTNNHTVYKDDLKVLEGTWRFIAIQYDSGALKVFIDGVQILNIPNYKLEPTMISIEGYSLTTSIPRVLAIKNVVLTGIKDGAETSSSGSETENTTESTNGNDTDSNSNTNDQNSESSTGETTFSGLEALDEGNGIGWRLIGKDPNSYGDIGYNAVDLSHSDLSPVDHLGAVGNNSLALGTRVSAGASNSVAIGSYSGAKGSHSMVLGTWSYASKEGSVAIGYEALAGEDYSIAMGKSTRAEGQYAVAIGNDVRASGYQSFAIGSSVKATGSHSFAVGNDAKATGIFSTSIGVRTEASSGFSTAIGRDNIGEGDPQSWTGTDPLFEIGNGGVGYKSNALTVLKNGNVGIGDHKPNVKLQVSDGSDASLSKNSGFMILGGQNEANLVFDDNEIMARNNGSTSTLYFQRNGGDLHVGGALAHSSDKRLKKDIAEIPYGLDEILQLKPKSYHWKNRTNTQRSLGLIAQEVQPIIKEIVHVAEDEDKTLSLNYTGLIPVLVKALQEQQNIIDNQNKKIEDLSLKLGEKDDELSSLNLRLKQIESLLNIDN